MKIILSDETNFKLSDTINRLTCIYWAITNPHIIIETTLNQPGVPLWSGVPLFNVLGPYVLKE
jgi:hypothetical protein